MPHWTKGQKRLVKITNGIVVDQWAGDTTNENEREGDWVDVTDHPDLEFMGRTYNGTSFGPLPIPVKSRRQQLKEKPVWTPADRDEVLRLLL